jgi:dTDP-4-dehydrorhamnose 3,5-epimerase-like enzyme
VDVENLTVHEDERGFLVELFRTCMVTNDPFAALLGEDEFVEHQVTLVEIAPGHSRAGLRGRGKLIVEPERPDTIPYQLTIDIDDHGFQLIDIPAGIGHLVENTGDEPLWLIYLADRWYDETDPDTVPWSWK